MTNNNNRQNAAPLPEDLRDRVARAIWAAIEPFLAEIPADSHYEGRFDQFVQVFKHLHRNRPSEWAHPARGIGLALTIKFSTVAPQMTTEAARAVLAQAADATCKVDPKVLRAATKAITDVYRGDTH